VRIAAVSGLDTRQEVVVRLRVEHK
jgi:hypothetical protein